MLTLTENFSECQHRRFSQIDYDIYIRNDLAYKICSDHEGQEKKNNIDMYSTAKIKGNTDMFNLPPRRLTSLRESIDQLLASLDPVT